MTMETVTLLGLMAGTFTTVSFVPQVIKIWQTKSARDVSLGMFLLFALGVALWMAYGFLVVSLPIIIANAITLALAVVIIFFKLKYK
jgi:MtN3 and saliva related transmembrane protein